jgi:uncharacterized protein with GYD domain
LPISTSRSVAAHICRSGLARKIEIGHCVPWQEFDERNHRRNKGETMPLYLSRFSYTPETWARLIGNPEDRRKAAQSYIESVGGKLHGFWYAFGEHDGYNLWEAPDNVSMAAVALAIGGGGALSSFETTVLLTVEETMEALRKAEQLQYRAPGT